MGLYDNELYLEDIKKIATDKNLNFELLKSQKILVTGASGLLGSFLIDVLMYRNNNFNDNIKIYALCRNKERLLSRFNIYNLEEIKDNNNGNLIYIIQDVCSEFKFNITFDYIIHAASNTHPRQYSTDPVGTITTNVIGLNNILTYSINHRPKRIFMASSVEIYGDNKNDVEMFNENYLGYINCNTLRAGYPESKRVCEALCQAYISQYDLDIVIGRLSRIYGPTMLEDDSKVLAQFIKNVINNEDIVLKSNGNQLFSYTYSVDAADAILKILLDGINGEAYNVGDKRSDIRLKDLADILAKYNKKSVVFELPDEVEKKGFSMTTKALLDSQKIKNLGWKPFYTIEEGIKRTISILKKSK